VTDENDLPDATVLSWWTDGTPTRVTVRATVSTQGLSGPMGWVCPRCGRVWAPWVAFCNCDTLKLESSDSTSSDSTRES
jgi:uncharacterized OB-fold protein